MNFNLNVLPRKIFRIRRSFAIAALILILTCYSIHLIRNSRNRIFVNDDTPNVALRESFLRRLTWQDIDTNTTEIRVESCRNTVQGKDFISDERGYFCRRRNVESTGCCPEKSLDTQRFTCQNCDQNKCCQIYEVCVSCCLQPENKAALSSFVRNAVMILERFFVSMSDQFELCLSKCRTSSLSVQHENTYRDPLNKYCFGEHPPRLTVQMRK